MKTIFYTLIFSLLIISCKDKQQEGPINYSEEELDVTTSAYPENIAKIFDAHGGLDRWKSTNTLVFGIEHPEGLETTTTDLKSRKSLIETDKFKIGYDGKDVWLQEDGEAYKGNAKFYYNLMFYFYAMPFVLADDGINYAEVEPLEFEGDSYPGIKISYEAEVGESPDDEYIVYFNPETYQMEWLAYTVTYFSKEKSKEFSYIKYDQWETIEGLKLPKAIQWYSTEGKTIKDIKNTIVFVKAEASKITMKQAKYAKPEGAVVVAD